MSLPHPERPRSGRPAVPPRTPRYAFEPNDRVVIDGEEYAPESDDEFEHRLVRVIDGMRERFSHETIAALMKSKSLRVRYGAECDAEVRLRHIHGGEIRMRDLPEKTQHKVFFRQLFCDHFLMLEAQGLASRSDNSLRPVIADVHSHYSAEQVVLQSKDGRCGTSLEILMPPSPGALRIWVRRYEKGLFRSEALLDRYGRSGNHTPRLPSEERELIQEFADRFASRLQPTKASCYEDLGLEIERLNVERAASDERLLRLPSRKAFERAVEKLDRWKVMAGRLGPEAARKKLYIVHGGVRADLPLDRIELDEWFIPLHLLAINAGLWEQLSEEQRKLAEKKRVWLSTAIDVATCSFLAARIIPAPSLATQLATLQMSVSDKAEFAEAADCETPWDAQGVGTSYVADGAFKDEFKAAIVDMRAAPKTTPKAVPQMRGKQERAYRTLHTRLISRFDGRAFENVVAKGDYDAVGNASIDEDELGKAIVRYIVDFYHNDPHDGLRGETPRHAWLRLITLKKQKPLPDAEDHRNIFGATLQRKVTNHGVEIFGLHYQSIELQEKCRGLRKKVEVRFDQFDLGAISVNTKDGWLPVPCVRDDIAGVSAGERLGQVLKSREENAKAADEVKGVRMRALRAIVDLVERSRQRGNIASPVLSGADYEQVLKDITRDYSRGEESGAPHPLALSKPSEPKPSPGAPRSPEKKGDPGIFTEE